MIFLSKGDWSESDLRRSSLIGGVGDLHSAVLGGEWIGWVLQLRLAVSNSY